MKDVDYLMWLLGSVNESLDRYHMAKIKRGGNTPFKGYDVEPEDCKCSIRRRIMLIREELLKISKSL